jgi:hypothetical protein
MATEKAPIRGAGARSEDAARFTAGRFSFYDAGMAKKRQERDPLAQSGRYIAEVKQSIKKQLEDALQTARRPARAARRSHHEMAGDWQASAS